MVTFVKELGLNLAVTTDKFWEQSRLATSSLALPAVASLLSQVLQEHIYEAAGLILNHVLPFILLPFKSLWYISLLPDRTGTALPKIEQH